MVLCHIPNHNYISEKEQKCYYEMSITVTKESSLPGSYLSNQSSQKDWAIVHKDIHQQPCTLTPEDQESTPLSSTLLKFQNKRK